MVSQYPAESKRVRAVEISAFLDAELHGEDLDITGVISLRKLKQNLLAFVSNSRCQVRGYGALLLVRQGMPEEFIGSNSFIAVDNPRLAFAKVIDRYFAPTARAGISSSSFVSKNATVPESCSVGEGCVIEDDVKIGERCHLDHHAVIKHGVRLGNDCRIGAGSVIGVDGLGTAKEPDGTVVVMRHLGSVLIGDRFELGANSTIGRGILEDTVIENGVKTGPMVNIGHNSHIGRDTQIAGRAHISGSVKIGPNCFIGANCSIRDKVRIGEHATIGIGSIVGRDVDPHATILSMDALPMREHLRMRSKLRSGVSTLE